MNLNAWIQLPSKLVRGLSVTSRARAAVMGTMPQGQPRPIAAKDSVSAAGEGS